MQFNGKWIDIYEIGRTPSRKTLIFVVRPKNCDPIGTIRWHAARYAFYPNAETVFDQDCLRDIANFCESATKSHNQKAD